MSENEMVMLRESPWGPLPVADAHVHFFSHSFFTALIAQKPGLTLDAAAAQLGWQMPPEKPEDLADLWVAELDKQGVGRAALIASVPGDQGSVTVARRAYPERFLAYAMVNPRVLDPEKFAGAFAEVQVACLFPTMHCYSIHDECVRPIFEWALHRKRAVFVHCGVLSVGVRDKLGLPSLFDMRYSNPVDLHAIARRYPDVPIILPHFGAGYFREALMLADLCPNVYFDTSSSNHWVKYLDGKEDLRHVFRRALDILGPRRLLFGTDSSFFPRGWQAAIFEHQATALYELGLSEEDAQLIFGKNLLRIVTPPVQA